MEARFASLQPRSSTRRNGALSLEGREEECRGRESTQSRARRGATEIWQLVLYNGNWQGGEQKLLSLMLLSSCQVGPVSSCGKMSGLQYPIQHSLFKVQTDPGWLMITSDPVLVEHMKNIKKQLQFY
jgi:hypothetical protein